MRITQGFVYVLAAGHGPKKIGASLKPQLRVKQLRHLFPSEPRVAWKMWQPTGCFGVECFTFKLLRAHALGGEMFDVTVEQAAKAIREAASAIRASDFSAYRYDFVPRAARTAAYAWVTGATG